MSEPQDQAQQYDQQVAADGAEVNFDEQVRRLMDEFRTLCAKAGVTSVVALSGPDREAVHLASGSYLEVTALLATLIRKRKAVIYRAINTEPDGN